MIRLYEYLVESVIQSKKFNRKAEDLEQLAQINKNIYILDPIYKDFIYGVMDGIKNTGEDKPFIASNSTNYIKIHPNYAGIVKSEVLKDDTLSIKNISGEKFIVKDTTHKNRTIIEIGRGSVGRISTESQEKSTCQLFNDIVEHHDLNNIDELLNDKDYIFNLISDLYENADDLDKTWIYSFGKQIKAIIRYLEGLNLSVENYRAVRFGDKNDPVGKWYTNMVKDYTAIVGGKNIRKDTFDPTDIILYDKTMGPASEIKINNKNVLEAKKDYLEKVFNRHFVMGVSLKKINNNEGRAELFNIDNNINMPKIENIRYINDKENNITLMIEGNFRFNAMTDSSGDIVGSPSSLLLTLRTFGSNNIAMDLTINEKYSPAIGKVPTAVWRGKNEGINCQSNNIGVCVKAFKKWFDNLDENQKKIKISRLVQAAAKEGPNCFPFILIH